MPGEVWWVLPTAVLLGAGLAAAVGLVARAARRDEAAEPEEPAEWDKLAEDERNFLRSWAKHRK